MFDTSLQRLAASGVPMVVLAAVLSLGPVVPCAADVEPIGAEVADHPSGRWSTIRKSGPTRMLYATAWDTRRDRMLIFGGHPLAFNDVWYLDPSVPEWKEIPTGDPMPSPRFGASAIYDPINDRLVVYGGWTNGGTFGDVWALSLSGEPSWTQLSPAGPAPLSRTYHAAVYDPVNHRMVVFGGHYSGGYDGPVVFLEDTWTLSLGDSPAWTRVSGPQPSARNLMSGAYDPIHQRMIIFGGWTGVGYLSDTWSLSLAGTPSWTRLSTSTAPSPRREYALAYDSETDRMVLFGGFTGFSLADPLGRLDDVWQLDGQTNHWQFVQSGQSPATRRCSAGAVFDPVGRRMIVLGGYGLNPSGQLDYLNQTLALSLSGTPGWADLFGSPLAPSRRREGAAVYDPDHEQMIQFSGTQPAGPLDSDVWRLSLNGPPQWTREVVPDGPTSRHGHAAVWDSPRHRMLMMGGYDDQVGTFGNDMWALTLGPVPAWTPLATTGTPPSPRMMFGMVHDTREDRLLIFGGHPTFLNDVWELPLSGPDALQWNQLTPSGVPPAPRWGMSMVYDRDHDRAIIFGGTSSGGTGRNDTWALDLRGGDVEWTELETGVARPAPRFVHSAIFDEKRGRMVIYGGATGSNFLDDVWEMSPSRHRARWEPMAPDGESPGTRDLHSAVYDPEGDRMVVFGGFRYPSEYFNDTWFLEWGRGRNHDDDDDDGGDIIVNKGGGPMSAPSASASAVLALTRIHPNPSSGPISITFSLPRNDPATLELVDVAGRVVQRREVGALGPGTHTVSMGRQERVSAGIYFISLTQGGERLYRRYSVVR